MRLFITILSLAVCLSTSASDIERVTHDLKYSLENELTHFAELSENFDQVNTRMLKELERDRHIADDLSVRLYACKMDYVFDLTFLLKKVEEEYKRIETLSQPDLALIRRCEMEIGRYDKLLCSLGYDSELPQDWLPSSEHDTIVLYAQQLKTYYEKLHEYEVGRSQQYEELRQSFYDSYDYARTRYNDVHNTIIRGTGSHWWSNMSSLCEYISFAVYNAIARMQVSDNLAQTGELWIILAEFLGSMLFWIIVLIWFLHSPFLRSRWARINANPYIWCNFGWVLTLFILLIIDTVILKLDGLSSTGTTFYSYLIYVCLLQIALLMREQGDRASAAIHLYAPTLFMGFTLIFMRLFMMPSSSLQLICAPEVLLTFIWQFIVIFRYWNHASKIDSAFAAFSLLTLFIITIFAFMGYVFMAIQMYFFWMMEAGILLAVCTLYAVISKYRQQTLRNRLARFRQSRQQNLKDEDAIQVTWFYKLVKMVILPLIVTLSLPVCTYFALDLFNDSSNYLSIFNLSFYDLEQGGHIVLSLSMRNLTVILSLFFIFNYLKDIITSIYHQVRLAIIASEQKEGELDGSSINMALGDNLIPIVVWMIYLINCFILLRIPLSTLTFIFAGLATGIGFAMRDILNNIIYGIQLMAGRLRVGDYIICGDYRGSVTSISYQTTQMLTEEGALVNFSNADLFSRNFQNMTRQNPYEVSRIFFKIDYGMDVEKMEQIVTETMQSLNQRGKRGVYLLSNQEGIRIELRDMSDAGCEFAVRFGVVADRRTWFLPVARKAIYEALTKNGYDIPYTKYEILKD